jgi:hypothetical protein
MYYSLVFIEASSIKQFIGNVHQAKQKILFLLLFCFVISNFQSFDARRWNSGISISLLNILEKKEKLKKKKIENKNNSRPVSTSGCLRWGVGMMITPTYFRVGPVDRIGIVRKWNLVRLDLITSSRTYLF